MRTVSDLVDRIAEDLVWRRRELSDLRAVVQSNETALRSRVLIRASVALLYAHWEGFVKKASTYYLEFVANQRLPYRQLTANFIALKLKSKFSELSASEKISGANELAHFFCSELDSRSNIPHKKAIDTKSNLSSTVLIDILNALGLNADNFKTKLSYIDNKLVNPRNHIAHGEELAVDLEEYLELHDEVIALIELFRNEIENSSVQKKYIKT